MTLPRLVAATAIALTWHATAHATASNNCLLYTSDAADEL